jgi:alanine racemase
MEVLERAATDGFAMLLNEQKAAMDDFWQAADIQIDGDEALQQGLRFNLFHIMQSSGRDGKTGMGAKGLSGEGYEGHYFWDTEMYVLPVFIWTNPELAKQLIDFDVMQCIYSLEYAKGLNENAGDGKIKGHLKLDTGMGRIGFDCRSAGAPGLAEAKAALQLEKLDMVGVFMHYAVADTPGEEAFTQGQYDRFWSAVAELEATGHHFAEKHCRNSAGTLRFPEEKSDAVRAGIVLYGLTPSTDMTLPEGFRPVMALYSRVSFVKTVAAGESISYGRTYVAPGVRRIATVAAGYADGIPRIISNRGSVLIRGQRAPIVGRVCMDQFCVDVTEIEGVEMGDVVTVFGPGLPVEEVAANAETINYEVVCSISKRVPRIYK